jgi:hypothetical protein
MVLEHGRIKSDNLQEYSALEKPHELLVEATRYITDVEQLSQKMISILDQIERNLSSSPTKYENSKLFGLSQCLIA